MVKHRFRFSKRLLVRSRRRYSMIRPHAKNRPEISSFGRRFGHLVHPQLPGSAQNDQMSLSFFSNDFSPVRDANTLHVIGSYHDLTTCKVSSQNSLFWLSRVVPDAMVMVVGISCSIHVIRSGFVHEIFFSNFKINKTTKIDRNLICCLPFLANLRRTDGPM
jgi:hypothetical protein